MNPFDWPFKEYAAVSVTLFLIASFFIGVFGPRRHDRLLLIPCFLLAIVCTMFWPIAICVATGGLVTFGPYMLGDWWRNRH